MKSKKAAVTAERAQLMHLFLAETDLREEKREGGTLGIMQKKKKGVSPPVTFLLIESKREKGERKKKKKEIQTLVSGPSWLSLYFFFFRGWLPIV